MTTDQSPAAATDKAPLISDAQALWLRIGCGLLIGVVLHYTLYRMGMPIEPFIYQAF